MKQTNAYDWWKSQMDPCPYCKWKPQLGNDAISNKYVVACMNCNCGNMKAFYSDNWGEAIVKWNNYVRGRNNGKK